MKDLHEQTYYELLEIERDASQEEILKAYNKARTTYSTNSPALYSLMNKEEAQELLRLIDEAYAVLSNQFKRKQYDKSGAPINDSFTPVPVPVVTAPQNFQEPIAQNSGSSLEMAPTQTPAPTPVATPPPLPGPASHDNVIATRFGKYQLDVEFEASMKAMEDFTGPLLQKIRTYKNISLDQISDITKVSRPYLTAIENNDFACLPATVFVRGFLVQIAKALGLNSEKVATSYLRTMKGVHKK
jgi:curved DNA-binding protein CbpA